MTTQGDAHPVFISLERACERYDFPNTRSFVRFARRWGLPLCGSTRKGPGRKLLRVEVAVADEWMRGHVRRSA